MMLRWTGWSAGTWAGPALAAASCPAALSAPPGAWAGAATLPSAAVPALLVELVRDPLAPHPAVPAMRAAPSSSTAMLVAARRLAAGEEGVVMPVRRRAAGPGSAATAVVMRLVLT